MCGPHLLSVPPACIAPLLNKTRYHHVHRLVTCHRPPFPPLHRRAALFCGQRARVENCRFRARSVVGRTFGAATARREGQVVCTEARGVRRESSALPPATAIKAAPTKPIRFPHRKPHRPTCGPLPPCVETCPCVSELLMADQKEQRALRHANTLPNPPMYHLRIRRPHHLYILAPSSNVIARKAILCWALPPNPIQSTSFQLPPRLRCVLLRAER